MTTLSDVMWRTRRRLMGQQREPVNTLSVSIDADDTALTFTNAIRFVEGSRLSVGLETMLVVAVSGGGTGASVIRGMDGSPAAAHSSGDIVHINPTWTNFDIFGAVNDELADLSSPINGLFRIQSVDFDFDPSKSGYNLAGLTDFLDIWRIRYDQPGPSNHWQPIPRSQWRLDRAADTSEFASGVQLVLMGGGSPGHKVRVSYKATFDSLTAESDDVLAVSGLHVEAHDILSLGAAMRLIGGSEAQRAYTTTQADPRRGDEAPANAHIRAMQAFAQMREERIRDEAARLSAQYPVSLP